MSQISIDIPRKDHTMKIGIEKVETESRPTYTLYYNDHDCGCMMDNENGIWIYEPNGHEALILSAEEIQHLGKQILQQAG